MGPDKRSVVMVLSYSALCAASASLPKRSSRLRENQLGYYYLSYDRSYNLSEGERWLVPPKNVQARSGTLSKDIPMKKAGKR